MKIRLLPHHLYKILGAIFILNIFFLISTWAFHFYYYNILETKWAEGSMIKYVLKELTLASENTIATWYSSKLFLLVGVMAFVCFWMQRKSSKNRKEKMLSYGWLIFFLIFTLLSFDEIGSMHERIGNIHALNPLGDYPLGWVFLLGIPIVLVAVFMLIFSYIQIKRAPWAAVFAVAAILLFLSIPVQEFIEVQAWQSSPNMATWKRPVQFLLLEEGSEIFGASFMFVSTLIYIRYLSRPKEKLVLGKSLIIKLHMNKNRAMVWGSLSSIGLALLVMIAENNLLLAAEGDIGVMWNWLPAATAFLVAVLCIYIYYKEENFTFSYRNSCFFLAFLCLFLSAYYGSNMYNYFYYLQAEMVRIVFLFLLFPLTVLLAVMYIKDSRDLVRKTGFAAWAVLLLISLGFNDINAPALAYIAFSILFLTLFSKILSAKRQWIPAGSSS